MLLRPLTWFSRYAISSSDYTASNNKIYELERIWKEAVLDKFKVLFRNDLPRGAKETSYSRFHCLQSRSAVRRVLQSVWFGIPLLWPPVITEPAPKQTRPSLITCDGHSCKSGRTWSRAMSSRSMCLLHVRSTKKRQRVAFMTTCFCWR